MTAIVETIEVDRPQAVVFDYATDPSKFAEWQAGVVGGHMDGDEPTTVGTRCITRRRIGFAERPVTAEVTEINPPNTWGVHGLDGPIRAQVDLKTESISDARTRLTIAIDFEGHGIGKVLVPLVVTREARKEMPENLKRLKDNLERA
jgi:uncharacterized protein YndB with AHSA1/START domain